MDYTNSITAAAIVLLIIVIMVFVNWLNKAWTSIEEKVDLDNVISNIESICDAHNVPKYEYTVKSYSYNPSRENSKFHFTKGREWGNVVSEQMQQHYDEYPLLQLTTYLKDILKREYVFIKVDRHDKYVFTIIFKYDYGMVSVGIVPGLNGGSFE